MFMAILKKIEIKYVSYGIFRSYYSKVGIQLGVVHQPSNENDENRYKIGKWKN